MPTDNSYVWLDGLLSGPQGPQGPQGPAGGGGGALGYVLAVLTLSSYNGIAFSIDDTLFKNADAAASVLFSDPNSSGLFSVSNAGLVYNGDDELLVLATASASLIPNAQNSESLNGFGIAFNDDFAGRTVTDTYVLERGASLETIHAGISSPTNFVTSFVASCSRCGPIASGQTITPMVCGDNAAMNNFYMQSYSLVICRA